MSIRKLQKKNWALCIDAGEYEGVSVFALKLYQYRPNPVSEAEGFLHVIDEEGELYYYDAAAFLKVKSASKGLLIPLIQPPKAKRKAAVALYELPKSRTRRTSV